MTRAVNRLALGLAGVTASAGATAVLLAAAHVNLPAWWPQWLPQHSQDRVLAPMLRSRVLAPHVWSDPLFAAGAALGLLSLVLLLMQGLPRSPRRLRLAGGHLRTRALAAAVRSRAQSVPGVVAASVAIGGGAKPQVEVCVQLGDRTTPSAAVSPLLAVVAEASAATGLPLRARIRLVPAPASPPAR